MLEFITPPANGRDYPEVTMDGRIFKGHVAAMQHLWENCGFSLHEAEQYLRSLPEHPRCEKCGSMMPRISITAKRCVFCR